MDNFITGVIENNDQACGEVVSLLLVKTIFILENYIYLEVSDCFVLFKAFQVKHPIRQHFQAYAIFRSTLFESQVSTCKLNTCNLQMKAHFDHLS